MRLAAERGRRWEAEDLKKPKMPREMQLRNIMILCDINNNISRLCDEQLNRDVGGGYLRKFWVVKVTATPHTCTGLCEGMAAVTKSSKGRRRKQTMVNMAKRINIEINKLNMNGEKQE